MHRINKDSCLERNLTSTANIEYHMTCTYCQQGFLHLQKLDINSKYGKRCIISTIISQRMSYASITHDCIIDNFGNYRDLKTTANMMKDMWYQQISCMIYCWSLEILCLLSKIINSWGNFKINMCSCIDYNSVSADGLALCHAGTS